MTTKTPEQIAREVAADWTDYGVTRDIDVQLCIVAINADRAQRFEAPMPVAGVIQATEGGVFINNRGDYLIEPIGDDTLELICVRADGTTATGRGEWETGFSA